MDAWVSGSAGLAVIIEGNDVSFIDAENVNESQKSSIAASKHLLADACDIQLIRNTSINKTVNQLQQHWERDRGIRMLQILLDPEEQTEIRTEAAACFSSLISRIHVLSYVENLAFSIPLQLSEKSADISVSLLTTKESAQFVSELIASQPNIRVLRSAWENVSERHFSSAATRSAFELRAIETGCFRALCRALMSANPMNIAILDCYKALADLPNYRQIVADWTKAFVKKPSRREIELAIKIDSDESESDNGHQSGRENSKPIFGNFESVQRQLDGIVEKLRQGELPQARKFTDQLINWQLQNGDPKFAAKSLCSLAQEAKRLSQHSLQLEWVRRAVEVAPDDAWAHGQAGDAYLSLFRFEEAVREFEASGQLGDLQFAVNGIARVWRASCRWNDALQLFDEARSRFPTHPEVHRAWSGYCEVLRDMWRFEEALDSYEEAIKKFPEQPTLQCGRAAVLKDLGRFERSLEAYAVVIKESPTNAVAASGYADVLKTMGRLDEALAAYEDAVSRFPEEPIPLCGMADVLRTSGKYDRALATYQRAKELFPFEPAAFTGYAGTLKDAGDLDAAMGSFDDAVERFKFDARVRVERAGALKSVGRFEEALQAFDQSAKDFPYDLHSLTGRANLLKVLGHHIEALEAFDEVIDRRPEYDVAKSSKAAVLVLLGRYDEAENLLPREKPNTATEWVANHIRGMILLKKGLLEDALTHFTEGALINPFYKERRYFETALAAVKIRKKQFSDAVKILSRATDPIATILQIHSCCEIGKTEDARTMYNRSQGRLPTPITDLRLEIAARYKLIQAKPKHAPEWILQREADVLLQAA